MPQMDLSQVINDLASGNYTVTRSLPATYGVDGRVIAGNTSTFQVNASVQPIDGRDLLRLPEGLRTLELLYVFTSVELRTQGNAQDPDTIQIDGNKYQVQESSRWVASGNVFRAIVAK